MYTVMASFYSSPWLLFHFTAYAFGISLDTSEELTLPPFTTRAAVSAVAHHTLVFYNRKFCSGSFIGSKIVLTVASCFHSDEPPYDIYVKFGSKNLLESGQAIAVVEKKEHEFFQYKSELDNDIALLLLESHVQFNNDVRKIILFNPELSLPPLCEIVVTGWGQDITKNQENNVLQLPMSVTEEWECRETYRFVFTPSMFCAKYEITNLLRDSGGAAVYSGLVVGISSYGVNLDKPHIALFTNVSYFYKWIKKNTEMLLSRHCSHEREHLQFLSNDY